MKNICLKLVLFTILGLAVVSMLSPKTLAKDKYGTTWTMQATPSAVIADQSNNVYYAGYLASGSAVQMNPYYLSDITQPSETLKATTGAIFLSKLNSNLTYNKTYIFEAGAPFVVNNQNMSMTLTKVATDSASNVYLLGTFHGIVDFDPTAGADWQSSNGQTWSYLLEMNANGTYGGTYLWQDGNITLRDMKIDKSDNIYLLGQAANSGAVDITINLNPIGSDAKTLNAKGTMGFYTRLKASTIAPKTYNYDYSRTFKNTDSQRLEVDHIALTSAGNIFVYGVFGANTQMNFNLDAPGGDNFKRSSNGSDDLYLSKYDTSGRYLTTNFIGNSGAESAGALAVDNNDNVYYSGGFNGKVNFNPIDLTHPDNRTETLPAQRFLSKLNSDGSYGYTLVWNSNTLMINKITFDQNNLMYLVGISSGSTNYDPIDATDSQAPIGGNDAFMTVINSDKTYNDTYVWGGINDDKATDAAFDSLDNIYIAGSTQSMNINFDPTSPASILTPYNNNGENGYATQFSFQQVPASVPSQPPTPGSSNNNSSSNSSSGAQGFTCTNHSPMAPKIFQIWATQNTETLYFVPSADPQDTYTISYGLYSDAGMYNVSVNQSAKSGVVAYTINALNANTTYYFRVRANNGCMGGEWSNTLSLKTAYSL